MKFVMGPTFDFTSFEPPPRLSDDTDAYAFPIARGFGFVARVRVRVRVASAISLIVSVNESAQIAPRFDEGCKIEIPRDAFSTRGPVR